MIAIIISIISVIIVVVNFVLSILDRGKKEGTETVEEKTNQALIEYQLNELKNDYKNMAFDIKEIKKMLDSYKETFRSMIKDSMDEHIRIYHTRGN